MPLWDTTSNRLGIFEDAWDARRPTDLRFTFFNCADDVAEATGLVTSHQSERMDGGDPFQADGGDFTKINLACLKLVAQRGRRSHRQGAAGRGKLPRLQRQRLGSKSRKSTVILAVQSPIGQSMVLHIARIARITAGRFGAGVLGSQVASAT